MKVSSIAELTSVRDYLNRIGAKVRSMMSAVVEERSGKYWKDMAIIRFKKDGEVDAPTGYEPTPQEEADLKKEFATALFPQHKIVAALTSYPDEVQALIDKGDHDSWFVLKDEHGNVVMLQVRRTLPSADGDDGRAYIPWTLWDDDVWRSMEPEGHLPLWGIENIKGKSIVFIHEGAKAARHMHRMATKATPEYEKLLHEHPWAHELGNAAHIGWIGGALSPQRTDWSPLNKAGVKRVIIISDNDGPGSRAVPAISYRLKLPTFVVQFTASFPASFDLADAFPETMYKSLDGTRVYVGPAMSSCLRPATWGTDMVHPPGGGKAVAVIREHFRDLWAYVENADMFVCTEMPNIMYDESAFNKAMAPFSHVMNTAQLVYKAYNGSVVRLCYRPDLAGRIIVDDGAISINLHVPTDIKSKTGDAAPWLEFMQYLIPNDRERKVLLSWCATLIARPATRMEFGVLLVSEHQGIGKTTLGSAILAPLVGRHNTSWPSESAIVDSQFNEWLGNKRLIVVNEIYSGHSWKAYNKLKSYVTDKEVSINIKFQKPYLIENWAHIFACSNSMRALKMEEDDRRWFYPEVTEVGWGKAKFDAFYNWLNSGGLGIIRHWAETYEGDFIFPGERAPTTAKKEELIEDSLTKAVQETRAFGEALARQERPICVSYYAFKKWLAATVKERVYDTDNDLKTHLKKMGCTIGTERYKIGDRHSTVVMNAAGNRGFDVHSQEEVSVRAAFVRQNLATPDEVLTTDF